MTVVVGTPLDLELAAIAAKDAAVINTVPVYTAINPTVVTNKLISPVAQTFLAQTSVTNMRNNLLAAPLDSPTFTGTPHAPTPAQSDSDLTKLATLGYVNSAVATSAGAYLPLTGGTVTGDITIDQSAATASVLLRTAASQASQISFYTGATARWILRKNNTPEAAGDVGSDLELRNYHNDGSTFIVPLAIERKTGFARTLTPDTAVVDASTEGLLGRIATCSWVRAQRYATELSANLSSPNISGTTTFATGSVLNLPTVAPGLVTNGYLDMNATGNIVLVPTVPNTTNYNNHTYAASTAYVRSRTNVMMPEDFGTVNGVDDTAAVQAMFDYLSTTGGIGVLNKWYLIKASIDLNVTSKPFVVEGVGRYISGLKRNAASGRPPNPFDYNSNPTGFYQTVLDIKGPASAGAPLTEAVTLRSFGVDGNKRALGGLSHGIAMRDIDNALLEDLWVYDFTYTGISVGSEDALADYNNRVRDCHVNGGAGVGGVGSLWGDQHLDATEGGANGISLIGQHQSYVEGCLVENIHSQTPCIALQFKGAQNSRYSNCSVYNSLISTSFQNTNSGTAPQNCHFDAITITKPNAAYYDWELPGNVSKPNGVRIGSGYNVSADGIVIDGAGLANFIGVSNGNNGYGVSNVSVASISNCSGAGAYAVSMTCDNAVVELQSIGNVNTPVVIINSGSTYNTVRLGQKWDASAQPILAPYKLIQDDSGVSTNSVHRIGGPFKKVYSSTSGTSHTYTIMDGSTNGILTFHSSSSNEYYYGWVYFVDGTHNDIDIGADITVNNSDLTVVPAGKIFINIVPGSPPKLVIRNNIGIRDMSYTLDMAS